MRGKSATLLGDEDPPLGRGEREHLLVVETLQRRLLIERSHVVPVLLEPASNVGPGIVGVEQQPHAGGLRAGLHERIQLAKLVERAPAVLDECRDLFWEAVAVGAREAHVALADQGMRRAQPLVVARVRAQQLEDLPGVEPGTDYPRAPRCPAEGDAGEQARLGRLLGKLLDHHAARPARASHLIAHKQVGVLAETDRERLGLRNARALCYQLQRSGCSSHRDGCSPVRRRSPS